MNFINKNGYLELLNKLRPPMMALKVGISELDEEVSKRLMKHFDELDKFVQDVTLNNNWEITDDSDCWSSGGVDESELKQIKNIVKAHTNSQTKK